MLCSYPLFLAPFSSSYNQKREKIKQRVLLKKLQTCLSPSLSILGKKIVRLQRKAKEPYLEFQILNPRQSIFRQWIFGGSKQKMNQDNLGPVNKIHPEKICCFIKYISMSIMKLLCQLQLELPLSALISRENVTFGMGPILPFCCNRFRREGLMRT